MRRHAFVASLTVLSACAAAQQSPVRALLDEHVEWLKREYPDSIGRQRGDERFANLWTDESAAAHARRDADVRDRLARLRAVARDALSDADRIDADLLEYDLALSADGAGLRFEHTPVNSMDGPHVFLPQIASFLPFRTRKHYEDYAARLERLPALITQQMENMRAGLAAGRVPPRIVMTRAVAGAMAQASPQFADDPMSSPFFAPFNKLEPDDPLRARAAAAIRDGIVPAYAAFAEFLRDTYIPACRESIAASRGVDGPGAYDYHLRRHTTLPISAEEVHRIGLREVARLREEMLACIAETDFKGTPGLTGDALLREFIAFVRSAPRFYYTDAADLLRDYREIGKRVDPELPRLFSTLPRLPWGIRELPRFASASSPAAYYYPGSMRNGVPGYFMVNTGAMDRRPRYGMVSLTLHEAVPGHHLQGAITDELEDVHEFRLLLSCTAYVEGWALYAERLGLEMGDGTLRRGAPTETSQPGSFRINHARGLYADPYDNFGRLSDEMWRACRLVIDTGLHGDFEGAGWSREQAIEYLLANSAVTPADAANEVDRYISWPGQACAYMLGLLEMLALRERAQQALGDRFDLRRFHACILGGGVLPLPVLRAKVDRWIESGG